MEEICKAIYRAIAEGAGGGYGVFYEDELEDALPESERGRGAAAEAMIKLKEDGYIDVKYARGNAFCAAIAKRYPDDPPPPAVQDPPPPSRPVLPVILAAAAGGAAGSLICGIIFHVV